MPSEIDDVFAVVARGLPAAGVDFLMIGGHAVNHYGVTRATQDVDFMVAASDEEAVRRIMMEAGFTNVDVRDTVMFFNRPGSPLRVDFLKAEQATMEKLLANAVSTSYAGDVAVPVPQLTDLVAMKLFALRSGGAGREEKDFPDVVHLVIENGMDTAVSLRELCEQYGSAELYGRLRARIEELGRD